VLDRQRQGFEGYLHGCSRCPRKTPSNGRQIRE
jgi:hypothetical protein